MNLADHAHEDALSHLPIQLGTQKFGPAQGVKHDTGKVPYELLPPDALHAIAEVLGDGAIKYAERNWENGMNWGRVFGAAMRHLWAWWSREDKDPESGRSHLAHAACCVLFLLAYEMRKVGKDDRADKL